MALARHTGLDIGPVEVPFVEGARGPSTVSAKGVGRVGGVALALAAGWPVDARFLMAAPGQR